MDGKRRIDLGFGHVYVRDDRPVPMKSDGYLTATDEFGKIVKYWDYPDRGDFAYKGEHVKTCCPYCHGENVRPMEVQWVSVSENNDTATLYEWQCYNCDYRPFWLDKGE